MSQDANERGVSHYQWLRHGVLGFQGFFWSLSREGQIAENKVIVCEIQEDMFLAWGAAGLDAFCESPLETDPIDIAQSWASGCESDLHSKTVFMYFLRKSSWVRTTVYISCRFIYLSVFTVVKGSTGFLWPL